MKKQKFDQERFNRRVLAALDRNIAMNEQLVKLLKENVDLINGMLDHMRVMQGRIAHIENMTGG